jgi:RNA polymerase sigma-70 factor (ECF subfamily)
VETNRLLDLSRRGDAAAIGRLLDRYREDMCKFVEPRLDPKVRARIDTLDVVQDAQLLVARRLPSFLARRPMPFHLWVRKTAYEHLLNVHRDHRAARRTVDREEKWPSRSSLQLARPLLSNEQSPSRRAEARELAERVNRAVQSLTDVDREILLMRHVETLSYAEAGCLLDIDEVAARKRYGRALLRLRKVLIDNGLLEDRP